MRRQFRWMVAVLLAGVLVGCGSDGDSSPADMGLSANSADSADSADKRGSEQKAVTASSGDASDGPTGSDASGEDSPAETDEPVTATDDGTSAKGPPLVMGTAGSDAPPEAAGGEDAEPMTASACDADPHHPDCIDTHVRGKCDIDTGFPGDEACLLPPPPGEGIQIHIGPDDYDDPEQIALFTFAPGLENSQCWSLDTPNDEDVHYQSFVLSGRPGTHHIINSAYTSPNSAGSIGRFGVCRGTAGSDSIGRIPGASKAYMPRFAVAKENEGLGYPIRANTPMTSDMHYFNYTEAPMMREYWLNLYTVPADKVTETPKRIRGFGGLGFAITPGTDMVYNYNCPIEEDGRITMLLGHTHAHAKRFTAWVNRAAGGEREKVFEAFDYLEPEIYAYNSVEQNPDFGPDNPGAVSGVLNVSAGDTLEWECHVINDSENTLRFTNFVDTGEMCNIWGESVGPKIDCNRF